MALAQDFHLQQCWETVSRPDELVVFRDMAAKMGDQKSFPRKLGQEYGGNGRGHLLSGVC
jgi:hypothetical protein